MTSGRILRARREATGMYRFLKAVGTPLLRVLFRLRGEGTEHIPASGPFIIASNHVSFLDPVVLGVSCPRPIHFIMLREFWEKPLLGWICRLAGSFPVDPDRPDTGALRQALSILRQGKVLGIFPEGGRSDDGRIREGKGGVALLAVKTGLPLVPVAIVGAERALPKGRAFPRPATISVRYGPPLFFAGKNVRGEKKALLSEVTEEVMAAIAALRRSPGN